MKILSNIIKKIRSFFKQDDFIFNPDDNIDEEIQDMGEKINDLNKEYIAEMSYVLLQDGSVDIKFAYDTNNIIVELNSINVANTIGELLFNINNGTYIMQSVQSLQNLGSNIEHAAFVGQILSSWSKLNVQTKDSPVVKPSEVGKNPYQQQVQEEM